jgi:hypothetical protein
METDQSVRRIVRDSVRQPSSQGEGLLTVEICFLTNEKFQEVFEYDTDTDGFMMSLISHKDELNYPILKNCMLSSIPAETSFLVENFNKYFLNLAHSIAKRPPQSSVQKKFFKGIRISRYLNRNDAIEVALRGLNWILKCSRADSISH